MRDQKTKAQIKKNCEIIPTPWYKSTTPHLFHPPIIHNNNTMNTEFLVQMRQSNKCGSVRNDEIFNLHLGSGVGPWVSIPCLLQDTSHINDIVAIAIKLRYVHDNVCSYISGTWVEDPQIHLKKSFLIIYIGKIQIQIPKVFCSCLQTVVLNLQFTSSSKFFGI